MTASVSGLYYWFVIVMPVLAPIVTDIPSQGTTFQLALADIPVNGWAAAAFGKGVNFKQSEGMDFKQNNVRGIKVTYSDLDLKAIHVAQNIALLGAVAYRMQYCNTATVLNSHYRYTGWATEEYPASGDGKMR